ncbi:FkbM family methyltransferase [Flavobacterium sp. RHBU_24]|uniref:FkbM family methyltransferase n=1 Tax=Flavobacterium sp. RHBU_24 TaxID=3391185 RepID=UPI00398510D6
MFLIKPTITVTAKKYLTSLKEEANDYKATFKGLAHPLYWPKNFSLYRFNQVISETFDVNDWHYYQKLHTEIQPGEILLDIGASEGLFALTVADTCAHMYLVEPGTTFNKALQKTMAPYADKVTILNSAVGDQDGEIYFSDDSLEGKVADGVSDTAQKININKIDTLIGTNRITYLKADIEGFELEMLKGAANTIRTNKPKIAITTYHDQNNPGEIIALIKSYVPEYNHYVKGIYEKNPKPVLIHFWV